MALDPETFDALIDTVRRFVTERLRPLEAQVEADDAIPEAVVQDMRDMGLFGLSIAEEHGGLGLTMLEEAKVAIEMGRTTPAFRSTFGTNVGIGSQGLVMAGSSEQKAQWLQPMLEGKVKSAFAMTEPGVASSDATNICAEIVRDGDDYVVNGHKWYISGAIRPECKLFIFLGKTDLDD